MKKVDITDANRLCLRQFRQKCPGGFPERTERGRFGRQQRDLGQPLTFTIAIGYGEVGGTPITGNWLAEAGPNSGALVDYATLVGDLGMQSFLSANDRTFLGSLPAIDPSGGGNWFLPIGQEKALGLVDPTTTEVDGVLGVSANFSYDFSQVDGIDAGTFDLVGILEHEMTHAMGRDRVAWVPHAARSRHL